MYSHFHTEVTEIKRIFSVVFSNEVLQFLSHVSVRNKLCYGCEIGAKYEPDLHVCQLDSHALFHKFSDVIWQFLDKEKLKKEWHNVICKSTISKFTMIQFMCDNNINKLYVELKCDMLSMMIQ